MTSLLVIFTIFNLSLQRTCEDFFFAWNIEQFQNFKLSEKRHCHSVGRGFSSFASSFSLKLNYIYANRIDL